jgi:hypothetical protein
MTYIANEGIGVFKHYTVFAKDLGGKPQEVWPTNEELASWTRLDKTQQATP